ncbi:hypothetical protein K2173_006332 [Erythroxylum novogranatense]|uniref:Uncharacterized protein n=1 Tax=Erythroxylum novogranatense TaxID=1862640 RepID=A0AAV8U323_9ROSI|nr:hypothetical protein K2173_006332 [Erythroxylum novogranatense]
MLLFSGFYSASVRPFSYSSKNHNCHDALIAASTTSTTTTDSGRLFREKLLYLTGLKIDTRKALTLNPYLRSRPISSVKSVESCLSSFGLHRNAVGRVLDMYPSLLTSDPYCDMKAIASNATENKQNRASDSKEMFLLLGSQHDIYPVLDFLLNEVNVPFSDISKSISRCPRLLVSGVPDQLRPAFIFLQTLGFVGRFAIDCQTTVLLVYNVESTLMGKIEFLMGLGFEFGEVKKMVVRSPGILTFSIDKNLEPKVEYFFREMKGDLEELKKFPQYFCFSLERKIKPRHRMLAAYGLKLPLWKMLKVSDGEFSSMLAETVEKR